MPEAVAPRRLAPQDFRGTGLHDEVSTRAPWHRIRIVPDPVHRFLKAVGRPRREKQADREHHNNVMNAHRVTLPCDQR